MKFWFLTILMLRGSTEYPYKFVEKKNCEKIGKDLVKIVKNARFKCEAKRM